MRTEVEIGHRAVDDHARGTRRVVEQHARQMRGKARGECRHRECGTHVRIVQLIGDLRRCGERIHEHGTAAVARREGREKLV